ncbi:gamma-secretase-activating protein [Conger conger]|uniref:gamma-secretase-activating protein n=1 Tax=Conger conger TaxID=82655 RepID=UPI002A59B341|nr:gamma-secretase-activating protein [Conger conger]
MLTLLTTFDLQKDVISHISTKDDPARRIKAEVDARILNVEKDGGVLYSWKGSTGNTRIGKYDPSTKQNKLLYTFDKEVLVSSCSVNKEETLLAVSLSQDAKAEDRLQSVSKCKTLLIEICPQNNIKVLKAVDCRIRVQFLDPETEKKNVRESHLLLLAEDGYVEQFHIFLVKQEGYRVVIQNPERLVKDRVAEDFTWVQWDVEAQRLFYLTSREKSMLRCVQFYPDCNFETLFELPLELPASLFSSVRFTNLGYDHYNDEVWEDGGGKLLVFTSRTGNMCVCYSHPVQASGDFAYTVAFVHRGYSKTFSVSIQGDTPPRARDLLFLSLDYYIVVYLAGHFLHFINSRQQDLPCHSLFLSGGDARLGQLGPSSEVLTLPDATLLDVRSGTMCRVGISHSALLDLLCQSRLDAQRLACLHCMLVYMSPDPEVELKIIHWICENVMALENFDQIQEFILASLYRMVYQQSLSLDKVLPYSSVLERKDLPVCLKEIPGVKCSSELLCEPVFRGKPRHFKGYWEELRWNMEKMKYFEAVPNPRYRTSLIQADWSRLLAQMNSEEKKPANSFRHIEENTKKVLSMVDTWRLDKKVVPLFQEEDQQQRALIGLMVDKLREHLNRHLLSLGKKKIDTLVVNYVAKLLELVRNMLETVWLKYELGPHVLSFKQKGGRNEWAVFHVMSRILEATKGLCLPLPPGYHTLLSVLGVRCLPRHTFLQYVDHGLLQLTETFVSRLMTDLDNSDDNEKLKFSILKRLPESREQKLFQLWDHPISSACISRKYVQGLLAKHAKTKGSVFREREKSCFQPQFLPLIYLTKILSDMESQVLNPFEEQEHVDARFVEETALKQTLILLGLEDK